MASKNQSCVTMVAAGMTLEMLAFPGSVSLSSPKKKYERSRTCEVKENPKSHDAKAHWRRQVLVGLADVLPLVGHIVQDLNI